MDNKKHLEASGSFAGLWVRTSKALRKAGYTSREEILKVAQPDEFRLGLAVRDVGRYADAELRVWLGLPGGSRVYWHGFPDADRRPKLVPPKRANSQDRPEVKSPADAGTTSRGSAQRILQRHRKEVAAMRKVAPALLDDLLGTIEGLERKLEATRLG